MSTTVFYDTFERHANAEGLKAHSTHYCPGCGHGLAQKYMAEAIDELKVQDRTVAVSPVGCSVFMYYYFDVGNTQAAHGRAPAVAVAHKVANPDSIVISYQGDGDLASIGLAEIIHAAQMGLPITVIFVNNGNYGMTGGQMAPTTLIGQKTATSPDGRTRFMGQPMKVAELIATLDGPIYVERVALYDNKQRNRAKKAIHKALQLQVERKGFAFIEVLAECPVQLKLDPRDAETWVKERMVPEFPLGVKKDVVAEVEPLPELPPPSFDPNDLLREIGAGAKRPPTFAKGFPTHLAAEDVAVKFAGSGGDGAQTAAMLLTRAGLAEGFDATHIPSYGPESRGGTSYADVHIAETEVLSPAAPRPHLLVVFNAPSLKKFGPTVAPGGTVIYDSTIVTEAPDLDPSVRVFGIPFTEIANGVGKRILKNVVSLGALQAATGIFPEDTFLTALHAGIKASPEILEMNYEAFQRGAAAVREQLALR